MAVGSQAIEVGCVVLLESGHIELPVSNEFVKNKTAVAMGGRWFFLVNFRTVIGTCSIMNHVCKSLIFMFIIHCARIWWVVRPLH
jgi:hypothetical protein